MIVENGMVERDCVLGVVNGGEGDFLGVGCDLIPCVRSKFSDILG